MEISSSLLGVGGVKRDLLAAVLLGPGFSVGAATGDGFAIQNGKESNSPAPVRNDLLGIAGSSLDVMLTNSMESLLVRAYIAARAHPYRFRTVAIPQSGVCFPTRTGQQF